MTDPPRVRTPIPGPSPYRQKEDGSPSTNTELHRDSDTLSGDPPGPRSFSPLKKERDQNLVQKLQHVCILTPESGAVNRQPDTACHRGALSDVSTTEKVRNDVPDDRDDRTRSATQDSAFQTPVSTLPSQRFRLPFPFALAPPVPPVPSDLCGKQGTSSK